MVRDDNANHSVLDCKWEDENAKKEMPDIELFVGIEWIVTVPVDEGYWEKGMQSLPMVAYMPGDTTTHDKVLKHFSMVIK